MQTSDLLNLIALGEDSQHQFKSDVTRSDALAQEMVHLVIAWAVILYSQS